MGRWGKALRMRWLRWCPGLVEGCTWMWGEDGLPIPLLLHLFRPLTTVLVTCLWLHMTCGCSGRVWGL